MNNFLKAGLMAMTACAATTSFADNSEGLQLAQVSDGFNAEQKYMASCFACHSIRVALARLRTAASALLVNRQIELRCRCDVESR